MQGAERGRNVRLAAIVSRGQGPVSGPATLAFAGVAGHILATSPSQPSELPAVASLAANPPQRLGNPVAHPVHLSL
jgi:hypothetical protein